MTYDICVAEDLSIIEVFRDDELSNLYYSRDTDLASEEGGPGRRAAWLSSTLMQWASQTVAQDPDSVMPVVAAVRDALDTVFSSGATMTKTMPNTKTIVTPKPPPSSPACSE
jgi:hypothetical protein